MLELSRLDEAVSAYWEQIGLDEQIKAHDQRTDIPFFFLLNGPPYASGSQTHLGTDMNQVSKDALARFHRMTGKAVYARAGFDSRGLPIENKVERAVRADPQYANLSKDELIGALGGPAEFGNLCKTLAVDNIAAMQQTFRRLLIHDVEDPYITFEPRYAEVVWGLFKKAYDAGLIYFSDKPVSWCPSCETGLASGEITKTPGSIHDTILQIPLQGHPDYDDLTALVMTTTPWSASFNVALGVNPNTEYVILERDGRRYLAADDSVTRREYFDALRPVARMTAEEVSRLTYSPLSSVTSGPRHIVVDNLVDPKLGSGIVHLSPKFAQEDDIIGRRHGLERVGNIDEKGIITEGPYAGMRSGEAALRALDDLRSAGLIFDYKAEDAEVDSCWRCDSPVVTRASRQMYLRVSDPRVRARLLDMADGADILPDYRKRQFKDWISSSVDWCISRSRTWNTPLPVWVSEDGEEVMVVGSREELETLAGTVPEELHTYTLDAVTFNSPSSGKLMRRVPFGGDVWLDAATASIAANELKMQGRAGYYCPTADLVFEGKDQINNWFYVLAVVSAVAQVSDGIEGTLLPFRMARSHGFIVDSEGRKMSKSLGNGVSTAEVLAKGYPMDAIRLASVMSLGKSTFEDIRFNWNMFQDARNSLNMMVNAYNFVEKYRELDGLTYHPEPAESRGDWLDTWILSQKDTLMGRYQALMQDGLMEEAYRSVMWFVEEDLSRTYLRLRRPVAWGSADEPDMRAQKHAFYATSAEVFRDVAQMLAPACPAASEGIYISLREGGLESDVQSVHLSRFKLHEPAGKDYTPVIGLMKDISEKVDNARDRLGIPKRRPFEGITVYVSDASAAEAIEGYMQAKLNSIEYSIVTGLMAEDRAYVISLDLKRIGPEYRALAGRMSNAVKAAGLSEKDSPLDRAVDSLQFIQGQAGQYAVDGTMLQVCTEDDALYNDSRVGQQGHGLTAAAGYFGIAALTRDYESADTRRVRGSAGGIDYVVDIDTRETERVTNTWLTAEVSRRIQEYRSDRQMDERFVIPQVTIAGISPESVNADYLRRQCRIEDISFTGASAGVPDIQDTFKDSQYSIFIRQ